VSANRDAGCGFGKVRRGPQGAITEEEDTNTGTITAAEASARAEGCARCTAPPSRVGQSRGLHRRSEGLTMNTPAKPLSVALDGGLAIRGVFPDPAVCALIRETSGGDLPLTIADPPYGNILDDDWDNVGDDDSRHAAWMVGWTRQIEQLSCPASALYVWGGIGRPTFRPFYRYLVEVERTTGYLLANHITWSKKRAYGVSHNYLFTREELAYLVLADDIRKPRCFNIPLLEVKRGYAGYNAKYPAKSEYLRRTSVWTDITEILRGKTHTAQKPQRLHEILIEVHTQPGEWVLDPFAGSGTTALAARKLGRRFVLVEADPEQFDRMVASLRETAPGCRREVRPSRARQAEVSRQQAERKQPHCRHE
jgi:site-specific DNA-methyltransferase (adenine-specific)